jgi:hypothetical protein
VNDRTRVRMGIGVATVLGADALVHVYWMTGSTWPARDSASLSRAVLNMDVPFTPLGLLAPFALLLAAATLILMHGGRPAGLGRRVPDSVKRLGVRVVAAGLLARGIMGLVWALGIGVSTSNPFYWLNLLVYTPACLLLFTATVISVLSPRDQRATTR